MIFFEAKLKYFGLKQKIMSDNLPFAINDLDKYILGLEDQMTKTQLTEIKKEEDHFICSSLSFFLKLNRK